MWLFIDAFLDRVCDVVVDLAAITEILLDFGGVAHVFLFAVLLGLTLFLFVLYSVSIGVKLIFLKLGISFTLLFDSLCLL